MNDRIAEVERSATGAISRGHQGHGRMMVGCGVMLGLALILAATGAVGATLLIGAAACIAMMAAIMLMMSRSMSGHDHHGNG